MGNNMEQEKKKPQKKTWKGTRGITLVETVMASVLFSFLFLALYSTLSSAGNILRMQLLNSGINQNGMQVLRSIHREIAESDPNTDENHWILGSDAKGNNTITFQVPVDWDNDKDVVQDTLTQPVEWGAYRFMRDATQQSWLDGWVRYRMLNDQLVREVLTSANGTPVVTEVLIPRDVQAFKVSLDDPRVSILLTVKKSDVIGQKGTATRTYETTFKGNVTVRNGR